MKLACYMQCIIPGSVEMELTIQHDNKEGWLITSRMDSEVIMYTTDDHNDVESEMLDFTFL